MVNIKDIAKLSGYSVGTVSRVINNDINVSDKARKIIEKVVNEQNFEPNANAKHLKQIHSDSVAVLVKGNQNIFFANLLENVEVELYQRRKETIIIHLDEDENEITAAKRLLIERKPKGLIFLGGDLENFKNSFETINIPAVLLTNTAKNFGFNNLSSFTTDDALASQQIIEYLLEQGHTRIGLIGGSNSKTGSEVGYRRLHGCLKAFLQHNIDFDIELQYESSRFGISDGYDALIHLMQRYPEMTAIFAFSDTIALGAMRALKDLGKRVPEDVSLIGFDGIIYADYSTPRLATVRQNIKEIASKGVEDLLVRIANPATSVVNQNIAYRFSKGESVRKYLHDNEK